MFRLLGLTLLLGPAGESPGAGIGLDPSQACVHSRGKVLTVGLGVGLGPWFSVIQ